MNIALNYLWGQIVSSGVLSNDYRRKRFIYSLEAISGMIRGVLEMIKKWYSDEGVEH